MPYLITLVVWQAILPLYTSYRSAKYSSYSMRYEQINRIYELTLANILTTLERLLISLFNRSRVFVEAIFRASIS